LSRIIPVVTVIVIVIIIVIAIVIVFVIAIAIVIVIIIVIIVIIIVIIVCLIVVSGRRPLLLRRCRRLSPPQRRIINKSAIRVNAALSFRRG
jgi:hypothetical protein